MFSPKSAAVDFHGSRLYTDAATLASEDVIMAARNDDGGPAVRGTVAIDSLANYNNAAALSCTTSNAQPQPRSC